MTASISTNILFISCMTLLTRHTMSCNLGAINFLHHERVLWDVYFQSAADSSPVSYIINPCLVNGPTCSDYVCRQNTAIGLGSIQPTVRNNTESREVQVEFTGKTCGSGNGTEKVEVIFRCGKALGSPVFLNSDECVTYFEWETNLACMQPPSTPELKCYVHDGEGHKYDLSPLMKAKGGYQVENEVPGLDLEINICRNMVVEDHDQGCASCSKSGDNYRSYGQIDAGHPLQLDASGRPYLHYISGYQPAGCSANASTNIKFHCPDRGHNEDPQLVSEENCQFNIEWETEFACPEDFTVVKGPQCHFTIDAHKVDIDLAPLKSTSGGFYTAWGLNNDGSKNYTYLLNICGDLGPSGCGDDSASVAVCQIDPATGSKYSLGNTDHQTLRYADEALTLTYGGGLACRHNGFQRTTVIRFSPGLKNELQFSSEDDCTYIFDFTTPLLQINAGEEIECRTRDGDHIFDLSQLTRVTGESDWVVMHEDGENSEGLLYINICQQLSRSSVTSGCPAGAAACLLPVEDGGQPLSLGRYATAPVYISEDNLLQLHYTHGSSCLSGTSIETFIRLKCQHGQTVSAPVLLEKSDNGCQYIIEWYTAYACNLEHTAGTNCEVSDPDHGTYFNLSPLMKTGGSAFYKTNSTSHEYYINVCAEVTDTQCDGGSHNATAVCQVDPNNSQQIHNTGQPSSDLTYFDDFINLTYTGGDPYHGTPVHYRKTELAFKCDGKAGIGSPEFLPETQRGYSFIWYTSYACPQRAVQCSAVYSNTHQEYDLSRLARQNHEENWVAYIASTGATKYIHINLCRPLNEVNVGSGCQANAAACIVQRIGSNTEEVQISNLGQAMSPPTVVSEGHLVLLYTNGSECTEANNTKSTYSTLIHLRCDAYSRWDREPEFSRRTGNCEFEINWHTPAACPRRGAQSNTAFPCVVKDPLSDFYFNMNPLKYKDYNFTSEGVTYKLNVCGSLHGICGQAGENVGICGDNEPVAYASSNLSYTSAGSLYLTYGKIGTKTYRIHLACNALVPLGQAPYLLEHQHSEHIVDIEFETSLACPPAVSSCRTFDPEGNEYDLSGLAKDNDNWLVVDPHTDHKYYINLCHELNAPSADQNWCQGRMLGGCQLDTSNQPHIMGYIQSEPVATRKNTVTVRYSGGDLCHKGTPNEAHRSTRIILTCAEEDKDPTFSEETSSCEYVIEWETRHACPIQRIVGTNCAVTDPVTNHVYDFTSLKKEPFYDVAAGGNTRVHLSLCDGITATSDACAQNSGSCLVNGSTATSFGSGHGNLTLRDNVLELVYTDQTGPVCGANKHPRNTKLHFTCDSRKNGTDGPVFSPDDSSSCTLAFTWPTALACPPVENQECVATGPHGEIYDLHSLTKTRENYLVPNQLGSFFLMSVCSTLAPQSDIACPQGSAVCKVDKTNTDITQRYVDVGRLVSQKIKVVTNTSVTLTYDNTLCDDGTVGFSKIILKCNRSAIETQPSFLSEELGCKFYFYWQTAAACPLQDQVSTTCSITKPETGEVVDFSSLARGSGYNISDHHGHYFTINICAPLLNSPCGADTASCQFEDNNPSRYWNSGMATRTMRYSEGVASLEYTGGDLCRHNQQNRSTVINFVCGKDTAEKEYVIEDDDCTYFIKWPVGMLCDDELICSAEHGEDIFDLTSLAEGPGNYMATNTISTDSVYINVCGPVTSPDNIMCPPSAAVCLVRPGQTATTLSLGRPSSPLQYDSVTQGLVLVYDKGSPCGTSRWKTIVQFVCERGPSVGVPSIKEIKEDSCEYIIEWRTNKACPQQSEPVAPEHCRFTDEVTGLEYDFSSLTKSGSDSYYQVPDSKFRVNICGAVSGCGGASVCSVADDGTAVSYGDPASTTFLMESSDIKMNVISSSACGSSSGKRSAHILFKCAHTTDDYPTFTIQEDCVVLLTWNTVLACPPVVKTCIYLHNGTSYDFTSLSLSSGNWHSEDSVGNRYWINLCRGVNEGPQGCPRDAAVCWQSGDKVSSLGSVNQQKVSWNDQQGSVVIEYEGGTTCTNQHKAKTRVILTCAPGKGSPVYTQLLKDGNGCIYEFEWQTYFACQQKRLSATPNNFKINDTKNGIIYDLKKLDIDQTFSVRSNGDTYFINLDGGSLGHGCPADSAVCLVTKDQTIRNIGGSSGKKFYTTGSSIQIELSSSDSCDEADSNSHIMTIINIHCDKQAANIKTLPVFVRKTGSCEHIFDWYSPNICLKSDDNGVKTDKAGGVPPALIAVIIISVILLLPLLIIAYHRRRRIYLKLRRIFTKSSEGRMQYSTLAQEEEDDFDVLENNTLLGKSSSSSAEYGISAVGNIQGLHNDSDEDMLL